MSPDPVVSVRGLKKYFDDEVSMLDRLLNIETPPVRAVDGVSFDIEPGQTVGLVGESGCGKTTTGLTIARLLQPTAGEVYFKGNDVFDIDGRQLKELRRDLQVVFQDPYSSLNPRMTIGDVLREPLNIHDVGRPGDRDDRVEELLGRVGLSPDHVHRYPHEFSGGQRQRICIARALALEPDFILLDEPVASLDVSVQAQILNLLTDLQDDLDLTYLFIAHDLSVVQYLCDRVAVMYLGKIIEIGPTAEIFEAPKHPYTRALLESIPRPSLEEQDRSVEGVSGDVPSPRWPPAGCSFHTRCPAIIQPPSSEVEPANFRSVAALWHRLETDPESIREYEVPTPESVPDETVDRHAEELRSAFGLDLELRDRAADRVLGDAIRQIVLGDSDSAVDRLAEAFSTTCRSFEPELDHAGTSGHRAACFLCYDDPPDL